MEPSEQLHFTLYNTCNLSKATHNKLNEANTKMLDEKRRWWDSIG